jgi:hypothetical protein
MYPVSRDHAARNSNPADAWIMPRLVISDRDLLPGTIPRAARTALHAASHAMSAPACATQKTARKTRQTLASETFPGPSGGLAAGPVAPNTTRPGAIAPIAWRIIAARLVRRRLRMRSGGPDMAAWSNGACMRASRSGVPASTPAFNAGLAGMGRWSLG